MQAAACSTATMGSPSRLLSVVLSVFTASCALSGQIVEASGLRGASGVAPVVLLPGFTGSGLYADYSGVDMPHFYCSSSATHKRVWVSISSLAPGLRDCWETVMTAEYDKSTDAYSSVPGVSITPMPGTPGVAYLDYGVAGSPVAASKYMAPLLAKLDALGLSNTSTIVAAPYDFRMPPDVLEAHGFFGELKTRIEAAVEASNGRRVAILGHCKFPPLRATITTISTDARARRQQWATTWRSIFCNVPSHRIGATNTSVCTLPWLVRSAARCP